MSMFSIATSGCDVVAGDGLLEGVEVDADQVDRLDPLALQRRHVLGVVAPRQQRRVQPRVQRLHPAAEDLLLAGELGDVGHLQPGLAQRARGAAGGEDLDPERGQRPWRSRRPRSCRRPRSAPGAPGSRRRSAALLLGCLRLPQSSIDDLARVAGVDPNPALARSCGSPPGRAGARPRGRPPPAPRDRAPPGTGTSRCRIAGPVSTPSSTKWTVTPVTSTPASSACPIASRPGKAGSRAGWTLTMRLRKRATKAASSSCM